MGERECKSRSECGWSEEKERRRGEEGEVFKGVKREMGFGYFGIIQSNTTTTTTHANYNARLANYMHGMILWYAMVSSLSLSLSLPWYVSV
jgi:hypothetical protein